MVPLTKIRPNRAIRPARRVAVNGTNGQVKPSEYIDALVCGYCSADRQRKVLVMFQAFFDESASEKGNKQFVLAGYVHRATTWALFSDDWKAALDAPPAIEYLHMVEAQNLRDQFKGWKAPERDAKVAALAGIIERHQPWSIECSVSQLEHGRIVKPVSPYDLRLPFVDCFLAVILKLAQWHVSLGLDLPIDYIFDERGISPGEAMFLYEGAKSTVKDPRILKLLANPPIFRDDKKVLPLQAADLLAWHLRRRKEKGMQLDEEPLMTKLIPMLHAEAVIDEARLRTMASDLSRVPNPGYGFGKKSSIRKLLRNAKPK
jgi:hypothetical protein